MLCLQETKTPDELFPREAFEALGYRHMLVHGMKGYNGVAILSRSPFQSSGMRAWCQSADCRHAVVELPDGIELHNIYVPAGGDVPDPDANPKFAHKLQFLDEMTAWFAAERQDGRRDDRGWRSQHCPTRNRCLVAQAASDRRQPYPGRGRSARRDCRRRAALSTPCGISCRRRSACILGGAIAPGTGPPSDRGRRLDHIWVTPSLIGALAKACVYRDSPRLEQGLGPCSGHDRNRLIGAEPAQLPVECRDPTVQQL